MFENLLTKTNLMRLAVVVMFVITLFIYWKFPISYSCGFLMVVFFIPLFVFILFFYFSSGFWRRLAGAAFIGLISLYLIGNALVLLKDWYFNSAPSNLDGFQLLFFYQPLNSTHAMMAGFSLLLSFGIYFLGALVIYRDKIEPYLEMDAAERDRRERRGEPPPPSPLAPRMRPTVKPADEIELEVAPGWDEAPRGVVAASDARPGPRLPSLPKAKPTAPAPEVAAKAAPKVAGKAPPAARSNRPY